MDGNPITPAGMAAMRARYEQLIHGDRPVIVEVVRWAAGNGDRSENGDYIYGRQKLREIDRELGHLAKRMTAARVVDPARQTERGKVLFGCSVEIADDDGNRRTFTLVGDDEQDAAANLIGWSAPIARALRGARLGDMRIVRLPGGDKNLEIVTIIWPAEHPG
ncbi:GreA/GreB family elongation factor [Sandarakinorhabdus sp.]|uniref:GreA/GreB family elongation factor n=1 Tax=Sandarakinorhabdus sp. TaxID=1916663 RepID=UPI003565C55A